jgi:hypothetical protein
MKRFPFWCRKGAASLAAAIVLLGGGQAAAQEAAFRPSDEDFVLLQLQVKKYRMVTELRGYQTPGGVCVDFADVIQALDLPIRLDKKSRRATGWLFSEDQQLTLDRDSGVVQMVNNGRQLQPGELVDTPEGWCIDTDARSGLLGVRLLRACATPCWFSTVTPHCRSCALLSDRVAPRGFDRMRSENWGAILPPHSLTRCGASPQLMS